MNVRYGIVEPVAFGATPARPLGRALRPDTFEKVHKLCAGYDIYALESEWRSWAAAKPAPDNPDAAFIAFCKRYAQRHPLPA